MISSASGMSDPIVQPIDTDFKELRGQIEKGRANFGDISSKEGKVFRSEVQQKITTLNNKIAESFKNKTLSEPTIDALISLRGEIKKLNDEIRNVDKRIVDYNKAFKPTWIQTVLSWIGLGPKPVKTVDFIRDDFITSGIQGERKRLAEIEIKHGIEYSSQKDLSARMEKLVAELDSGSFALFGMKTEEDSNPYAIGVQVMQKEDGKKPTIRSYAILLTDKGFDTGIKICSSFSEALNSLGAKKELQVVEKEIQQKEQQKQLKSRTDILTDRTHFAPDCKIQAEAENILKGYDKGAYIVWKDDKGYHLSGKNLQGNVVHSDIKFDDFIKAKGTFAEFIKDTGFSKPVGAIKVAEFFSTIKPLLDTHPESSAQARGDQVKSKMERDKPYFLLRETAGKSGIELVTLKKVKPWLRAERIDVEVKTFAVAGDGKIAGLSWEQFQNTEMKGFTPFQSVESRSRIMENVRALGPFSYSKESELTSRMQQFVDVMGAKASGCYSFYTVMSKTEEPELHICYVQAGKVLTKPVDVTSDTAIKDFNVLSGDVLLSKLLEKANVMGVERAKGFSVLDGDMQKIELVQSALSTKEHIQSRGVALADLQNVIKTFGDKAYGAYVLYNSPDDKGKVIARVYDQTGEKEYTLDLAANPGMITIGKEVVKELPKWAVQGCKVYNDKIAEFDRKSKEKMPGYFDSGTSQGASAVQDMLKHASLIGVKDIWFVHKMPYQGSKFSLSYMVGWIPETYSLTVVHRQGNTFKMVEREVKRNPEGGFTIDGKTKKDMDEAANSLFAEMGIPAADPKVSAAEVEKKWTMIDAKERKLATLDAKVGKDVGKLLGELDSPAARHYNITPQDSASEMLSQSFTEAGKTESRQIQHRFAKGYTFAWGSNSVTIDLYKEPGKYTVGDKQYDSIEEMIVGVTGQRNMKSLAVGLEEKREADKAAEQKRLQEEAEAKLAEVSEEEIDIPIARATSEIELPKLGVNNKDRWFQVGSRLTIAHDWWISKGKPKIEQDDAELLLRQILAMSNKSVWGKGGQLDKLAGLVEKSKEVAAEDMGLSGKSDEYYESQNAFLDFLVKSAGIS